MTSHLRLNSTINRGLFLQKCSQHFIGVHDETFPVAICNTSTKAISRSSRLFTRPHVAPRDRTTVRLSNGHSLLRQQENAVDIS